VRDLLYDEPLFLTDVSLSHTASRGTVLAARVMAAEGIHETTGNLLPFGRLPPEGRARFLRNHRRLFKDTDFRRLSPEEASELTANIMRSCLKRGAAQQIECLEVASGPPMGKQFRASGKAAHSSLVNV
jgi:hypothetical protein